MNHRPLGPDQCGAVFKRSAINLAISLTYDVKEAWNQGHVTGFLMMDIKGAFDGAPRNKLLNCL